MTADQYRAALKRLAISQRKAAQYLGIDERTSRRYAESGAPEPIARLLAMYVKYGIPKEQKNV